MARNLRWTIPFVSLKGKACLVEIYDSDGWSGTPTALSTAVDSAPGVPAADPFVIQEDDNQDTMTPVRPITGYINLIEKEFGGLDAIRPLTNREHFVKFYYDNSLIFCGFIQAQSFQNDWQPGPRQIQIPVVSALGIAGGVHMPVTHPAVYISDQDLLVQALQQMDAGIEYVVIPTTATIALTQNHTLNYCPYNGDYTPMKGYLHEEEMFAPKYIEDFLEDFGYRYDLCFHTFANYLILAEFQRTDSYTVYHFDGTTLTQTGTASGATLTDLTSAPVMSNDGNEEWVLPKKEVDIIHEVDTEDRKYDVNHLTIGQYITDYDGTYSGEVIDLGPQVELRDEIRMYMPAFTSTNDIVFRWCPRKLLTEMGGSRISFKLLMLQDGEYVDYPYKSHLRIFKVKLQCEDLYQVSMDYHDEHQGDAETPDDWQATEYVFEPRYDENSKMFYIDVYEPPRILFDSLTMTVMAGSFRDPGGSSLINTSFHLADLQWELAEDLDLTDQRTERHQTDNGSWEVASADVTDGPMIKHGYERMFVRQDRLQVDIDFTPTPFIYTDFVRFYNQSWRWRMMAMQFTPRDDMWRTTIHHSPIMD